MNPAFHSGPVTGVTATAGLIFPPAAETLTAAGWCAAKRHGHAPWTTETAYQLGVIDSDTRHAAFLQRLDRSLVSLIGDGRSRGDGQGVGGVVSLLALAEMIMPARGVYDGQLRVELRAKYVGE